MIPNNWKRVVADGSEYLWYQYDDGWRWLNTKTGKEGFTQTRHSKKTNNNFDSFFDVATNTTVWNREQLSKIEESHVRLTPEEFSREAKRTRAFNSELLEQKTNGAFERELATVLNGEKPTQKEMIEILRKV